MHCAADAAHPSSDIAAQLAAGLGILGKWIQQSQYTTDEDKNVLVPRMEVAARNAYAYAKEMFTRTGMDSSCSRSPARTNCIGSACNTDTSNSVRCPSQTVHILLLW